MARRFTPSGPTYIDFADNAATDPGASDFTLAFWFRRDGTPTGSEYWASKWGAPGFFVLWRISDGKFRLTFNGGSGNKILAYATASTSIFDGNWHHFLWDIRTGLLPTGRSRLYLDGTFRNSKSADYGDPSNSQTLRFGARNDGAGAADIDIAAPALWHRLLTDDEIVSQAAGVSPLMTRPLPEFCAIDLGRSSPERDVVGGTAGTLTNSPAQVSGPVLIGPAGPIVDQSFPDGMPVLFADVVAQSGVTAAMTPSVAVASGVVGQSAVSAQANVSASVGAVSQTKSSLTASAGAAVPIIAMHQGQSAVSALASASVLAISQADAQSTIAAAAAKGRSIAAASAAVSTLTSTTAITAGASAATDATSSASGTVSASVSGAATLAAQSDVTAAMAAGVPVSAMTAGTSATLADLTRAQSGAATVPGQSALVVETRALAPLQAQVAASTFVAASLSATASASTTVAGQSAVTALPTYPGVSKTITTGGFARFLATVGGLIRQ